MAAGEWSVASSRPSQHRLTLVAERGSPRGGRVRRQLVVDTCLGVVIEQSLYDESASLIARATLEITGRISQTGIVVPRRIELEWPEAELSLVIRLKDIEVNPSPIPASTWEVPRGLGSGPIDPVNPPGASLAGCVGCRPRAAVSVFFSNMAIVIGQSRRGRG
ncbi:MAG: hypothetical protein Ct9H300mP1_25480 [Planctomycetaceae bacterium]|nr:MAG: hypothetical protein Ct9H300mP1_25480 [Planctomycetaceae bacterium]